MTRDNAIKWTRMLWRELASTGYASKQGAVFYSRMSEKLGSIQNSCFLCQYAKEQQAFTENIRVAPFEYGKEGTCTHCPYVEAFGVACDGKGMLYWYWRLAETPERKKYCAQRFLEEVILKLK